MPTIKGRWEWNSDVAVTTAELYQSISFTSNGYEFRNINIMVMETNGVEIFSIYYEDLNDNPMDVAWCEMSEVAHPCPPFHIMNFGPVEQEVGEEFYNYFVANAHNISIATKLTQIAENEQKVYDAGYAKGRSEGGGDSYYDTFWDAYQNNGARTNYFYAFADATVSAWNKNNFKPKYDIRPKGSDAANRMFENFNSGLTPIDMAALFEELGITFDTSQAKGNFQQTFRGDGVERWGVIDLTQAINTNYLFYSNGNPKLLRIDKIICSESTSWANNSFQNQSNLLYIRFEGVIATSINFQWQTKLDMGSIRSIVNALSYTASGKTATFSKAAVNKAFETSEGANDGELNSRWADDLVGTHPNWTFVLV